MSEQTLEQRVAELEKLVDALCVISDEHHSFTDDGDSLYDDNLRVVTDRSRIATNKQIQSPNIDVSKHSRDGASNKDPDAINRNAGSSCDSLKCESCSEIYLKDGRVTMTVTAFKKEIEEAFLAGETKDIIQHHGNYSAMRFDELGIDEGV